MPCGDFGKIEPAEPGVEFVEPHHSGTENIE